MECGGRQKKMYSDNFCTQDGVELMKWDQYEYEMGEPYYFECDGDNTYVKISLVLLNDECSNAEIIYAGLGGCAISYPLYNNFYCEATMAKANLYFSNNGTGLEMCSSPLYCTSWNFMEECSQITTLEGQKIYGKMEQCNTGATSTSSVDDSSTDSENSSTDMEDSAHSHFVVRNAVVALGTLAVILFWV